MRSLTQLSTLWWMLNSVGKGFAQQIKMIPTLPQNQFEMFLVGFSSLQIMINPDKSQARAKGDWLQTRMCVIGYRWNYLDEPIYLVRPKPLVTELGIYHGLDSCVDLFLLSNFCILKKHRVEYLGGEETKLVRYIRKNSESCFLKGGGS